MSFAIVRRWKKTTATVTTAAVLAAGLGTVKMWEGLRTAPYYDIVGVLTVCYGETQGVEPRNYTPAECEARLATRLHDNYLLPILDCHPDLKTAPVEVQAMMMSLAYNIGVGGVCNSSSLNRTIPTKDWTAVCNLLPQWRKAGGRVVQGLVNRRADERLKCLGEKPL